MAQTVRNLLLLVVGLLSALTSPIDDCDETFNYWEPLHYSMFGHGLQTWEYCPQYSLRSWTYIALHKYILSTISAIIPIHHNKLVLFYTLRIFFALCSATAHIYLVSAAKQRFGPELSQNLWFFLLLSPGIFQSSTSFLPQTFVMILVQFSHSLWIQSSAWSSTHSLFYSITLLGTAVLLGWPFAGLLSLPMGIHMVLSRGIIIPTLCGVGIAVTLLVVSTLVDLQYYQRFTVPILNIVLYNQVQTSGQGGADIYGVEPPSFYPKNLLLNFNVVFVLFAVFPVLSLAHWAYHRYQSLSFEKGFYSFPLLLSSPAFIWVTLFQSMAHKEERFLYVIYPLLVLSACFSLELVRRTSLRKSLQPLLKILRYTVLFVFALLAVSRIVAQVHHFSAPLHVYQELSDRISKDSLENDTVNVCVGKEWYRFPSHFFLPAGSRLRFLDSGFGGLLPGEFTHPWEICEHTNALNQEEPFLYFTGTCDYIIDWDVSHDLLENYHVIYSIPFLDSASSPLPFRSLYLPFILSPCTFKDYVILQRNRTQKTIN